MLCAEAVNKLQADLLDFDFDPLIYSEIPVERAGDFEVIFS